MLGMPSNQAKDAVAYTPRAVLLKARKFIAVGAQDLSIGSPNAQFLALR